MVSIWINVNMIYEKAIRVQDDKVTQHKMIDNLKKVKIKML